MTATDLIILGDSAVDDAPPGEQTAAAAHRSAEVAAGLPADTDSIEAPAEQEVPPEDQDSSVGPVIARLDVAEGRLAELTDRLASTDAAVKSAGDRATAGEDADKRAADRLTDVEGRLDSAGSRLDSLEDQLAAVHLQQADHERALAEVSRTIAVAVERHTTDALVDTTHNLQLAVNSIAQLSLAMAESTRDLTADVSAESATALLDSFRVDLDAILDRLGFSPLGTTVGATFDPHRHRALKRVVTTDPAQDKVITTVIRDGYLATATGRILLFADVEVSRYRS